MLTAQIQPEIQIAASHRLSCRHKLLDGRCDRHRAEPSDQHDKEGKAYGGANNRGFQRGNGSKCFSLVNFGQDAQLPFRQPFIGADNDFPPIVRIGCHPFPARQRFSHAKRMN